MADDDKQDAFLREAASSHHQVSSTGRMAPLGDQGVVTGTRVYLGCEDHGLQMPVFFHRFLQRT